MSAVIASVETFRVDYPVAGHFKFFEQPDGRPPCRPTVVVKLTDEDGAVGWGQAVPSPRWSYETPESVQTTIERYLAPLMIGADPADSDELRFAMNRAIAPSFSTGQPIAKCGLDLALFDLTKAILGAELSSGTAGREPVQLSWTINVATLDEVEPQIIAAAQHGYRSFNVKVAPNVTFDVQVCQLLKRLAPQAFVWADANGGYDESAAAVAARHFADLGLAALEQPLPANRLTGYQRLVRCAALPIVMDEGVVSRVDLEEFCRLKSLSGVTIKVARCGGLREAAAIMQLAQHEGLYLIGSGLTDPDLALAASLKLFAEFALPAPAALNGPQYLTSSILRQPLEVREGALAAPAGPGLGVTVDEGKLASLLHSLSHEERNP